MSYPQEEYDERFENCVKLKVACLKTQGGKFSEWVALENVEVLELLWPSFDCVLEVGGQAAIPVSYWHFSLSLVALALAYLPTSSSSKA
jgi:hypothetical protein